MDCLLEKYFPGCHNTPTMCGFLDDSDFKDLLQELSLVGYSYVVYVRKRKRPPKTGGSEHEYCRDERMRNIRFLKAEFGGSPYYNGEVTYYKCGQGGTYKARNTDNVNSDQPKRKRIRLLQTKKIGCPSLIKLSEVIIFTDPQYAAAGLGKRSQRRKIIKEIKEQASPKTQRKLLITFKKDHSHPPTPMTLQMDKSISRRIEELVREGVTDTSTVEQLLRESVPDLILDKSDQVQFNSKYFPSKRAIYSQIYRSLAKMKVSPFDQDALLQSDNSLKHDSKLTKIKISPFDQDALLQAVNSFKHDSKSTKIHIEPYKEISPGSILPLLFCHQEPWQQELLLKYGNDMCLLDATYKTSKYALPLFFIVVKTNVKYMPVATFVTMPQSTDGIKQALLQFIKWNPLWKPKHFMLDFSESEIKALESTFPQSQIQICAFHREQDWVRWTKKSGNIDKSHVAEFLKILRNLAAAETCHIFNMYRSMLQESLCYTSNSKVQNYINEQWLRSRGYWAKCFTSQTFESSICANNGIECLNQMIKENYLKISRDNSLVGVIKAVIKDFLPDMYSTFIKLNQAITTYNTEFPTFLYNRPEPFVTHVLSRMKTAKDELTKNDYNVGGKKILSCKYYTLDFARVTCTCEDFDESMKLPCKHFCGAFLFVDGFGFDALPDFYRKNPLFTLNNDRNKGHEPVPTCSTHSVEVVDETLSVVSPLVDLVEELVPNAVSNIKDKQVNFQAIQEMRDLSKGMADLSHHCDNVDKDAMRRLVVDYKKLFERMQGMVAKSSETGYHFLHKRSHPEENFSNRPRAKIIKLDQLNDPC